MMAFFRLLADVVFGFVVFTAMACAVWACVMFWKEVIFDSWKR